MLKSIANRKLVAFFLSGAVSAGLASAPAAAPLPSIKIATAPLVSPSGASTYYGASTAHTYGSFGYGAGSTNPRPPEIVELARALKGDPDLIFQYVKNTIDVHFSYGLQKGAVGAIIDHSGTPFDQAHLLVELLRQSGHTANYQLGTITLTGQQFLDWSGLTNAKAACQFLAAGGMPAVINGSSDAACGYSGSVSSIQLAHIWVISAINGQNYLFDPGYKTHSFKPGVNLLTAMGYTVGGAFNAVRAGAFTSGQTTDGNWIKTLGNAGIKALSQALLTSIRGLSFNQSMEDIVGGGTIARVSVPAGGFRQTSFPYTSSATTAWSGDIPNQYRSILSINPGVGGGGAFFVDETYGRRMRLETNLDWATASGGNQLSAVNGFRVWLEIDGVPIAETQHTLTEQTGVSPITGEPYKYIFDRLANISISATHPFVSRHADQTITTSMYVAAPIVIINGWGDVSPNLAAKWASEIGDDKPAPKTHYLRACDSANQPLSATGCTAHVPQPSGGMLRDRMVATWLGQFSRVLNLNAQIGASKAHHHHSIGVAYSDQWSFYVNAFRSIAPSLNPSTVPNTNCGSACVWMANEEAQILDVSSTISVTHTLADEVSRRSVIYSSAALGAALEGDLVVQLLDLPQAVSTVSRFAYANNAAGAEGTYTGWYERTTTTCVLPGCSSYPDDSNPRQFFELTNTSSMNWISYKGRVAAWPGGWSVNTIEGWRQAFNTLVHAYTDDGFTAFSSQESFSGPGPQAGTKSQWGSQAADWYREEAKTRGGGFVAVKFGTNGEPLEIAHIVTNKFGRRKGGASSGSKGDVGALTSEGASNMLKSRFSDRSQLLSVDLKSGRAGFATQPLLTTGGAGTASQLSVSLIYSGPGTQEASLWNPQPTSIGTTSFATPYRGFTTNWDTKLALHSDAYEAMGQTSPLAATTAIATMVVMQDLYRSGQTSALPHARLISQIAGPLAFLSWHGANHHNTVTISQGGQTRRFAKLVDGSFTGHQGDISVLTQINNPQILLPACFESYYYADTNVTLAYYPSNVYAYDNLAVSFQLKNRNGDVQTFDRWTYLDQCRRYGGWKLKDWTFPHGHQLAFTYGVGGKLTRVQSNTGRAINFSQTSATANASPAAGSIIVRGGTDQQVPGQIADENGRAITLAVDTENKITHLDGGVTKLKYCPPVARSQTQRPIPFSRLCEVFEPANTATASLQYTYDSIGNIKEVRDAVAVATPANRGPYKFYIADGTRGEREDPITPTSGRYIVEYDDRGRPIRHIDELLREVNSEYDAHNRLLRRIYQEGDEEIFQYDTRHNITRMTKRAKPGSGLADILVDGTWDATWNKPLTVTAPYSTGDTIRTTTFTYYAAGLAGAGMVKDVLRPASILGGVQPKYTYTYAAGTGFLTQETSPIGAAQSTFITTNHSYDAKGNRIRTLADDTVTGLKLKSEWQYNAYGDVTRSMDPRGYVSVATYWDTASTYAATGKTRRLAEQLSSSHTVTAIGNAVSGYLTASRTWYDLNGRAFKVEGSSSIVGTAVTWNTINPRSRTIFTLTGKAASVTDASGDTSSTTYDALDRPDIVTDPISRKVKTVYNAAGEVTQLIKAHGTALQQIYAATTYSPNGQVLTVTDARGNVTKNVYDGFDRPIKLLYPDATQADDSDNPFEQVTYDGASRKLSERKRGGQLFTFAYDNLDRVTSRAGSGMPTRSFTYDLGSRIQTVADTLGAATVASHQYTYDSAGRAIRERRQDWNLNVDFTLDAAGNTTRLTWPDGFAANYTFDGLGRVDQITANIGGATRVLRDYDYDVLSRRVKNTALSDGLATQGAGEVISSYVYEIDDDLASLSHNYPGTTTDLAFTHTTSPAGQLLSTNTSEALNRYAVLGATGTQTYQGANALNQYPGLTPVGGTTAILSYDLNGNLTGDGASVYAYDAANRLTNISGAVNAAYAFDALDRRVAKQNLGTTTRFLHAGSDEIGEYTNTGALIRRYVPGSGTDERAAMIDSGLLAPPITALKLPHTDRLGSVMAVTDSTGAVTERFSYNAFGVSNSTPAGYPFRYTGQRLDPESGLMFYKARVYSQTLGRFLQTDPIGTKDDLNLYAYTGNDPVNKTDPTGMWAGIDDAIAIGVGATIGVGVQGGIDLWNWEASSWQDYAASAAGGAAGGEAALYTANPFAIGAANAGASSVTRQLLTTGSIDLERTATDTAIGAGLGFAGSKILPAAAKLLPNSVKGEIGETLSGATQRLRGREFVRAHETVRLGGRRYTKPDLTMRNSDGSIAYIESKFGTGSLRSSQRLAQDKLGDSYIVDYWNYGWVGGVGANTAASGW